MSETGHYTSVANCFTQKIVSVQAERDVGRREALKMKEAANRRPLWKGSPKCLGVHLVLSSPGSRKLRRFSASD